jgi:acetyl-CoA carboxylase biotin carboxyl carrier protein
MTAPMDEGPEAVPMPETGPVEDASVEDASVEDAGARLPEADASLLALVDRLTAVLDRSDLGELEVTAGETTIVVRAPAALGAAAGPATVVLADRASGGIEPDRSPARADGVAAAAPESPARPSVKAPLTGIFYGAPSPGATPYVSVGDHVSVGQLIGLIEAMKLFNEIKSDLAGRVVRVCVDNGALVKAKQPLIEVEPA